MLFLRDCDDEKKQKQKQKICPLPPTDLLGLLGEVEVGLVTLEATVEGELGDDQQAIVASCCGLHPRLAVLVRPQSHVPDLAAEVTHIFDGVPTLDANEHNKPGADLADGLASDIH